MAHHFIKTRACISTVPASKSAKLSVEFPTDLHW